MSKYSCNCEICSHSLCAKNVPIFSSLSEEEIIKIARMTGHKTFKKGEILFLEGQKLDTLFIINEGKVKISRITKEGKEQIVHILNSGDFFGELSLFSDIENYNLNVYAISDVKICTLMKKDMKDIIMTNPEISLKILQVITKRLKETEELVQNLASKDAETRIAYMLLQFAEKYGVSRSNGLQINLPINREGMANYIGVTRETISRKLSKFEDLGIIALEGNKVLTIRQLESLKSYIE